VDFASPPPSPPPDKNEEEEREREGGRWMGRIKQPRQHNSESSMGINIIPMIRDTADHHRSRSKGKSTPKLEKTEIKNLVKYSNEGGRR
jgi:hypothetical protein